MNYSEIIKKSWKILWGYKTLWAFGILLALSQGGSRGGSNFNFQSPSWLNLSSNDYKKYMPGLRNLKDGFFGELEPRIGQAIIYIIIATICLLLVIGVLFTVLRLVSRVALIRMVNEYDQTGEKTNWRAGLKMGWSRRAFRMFLIDLLISIPIAVAFILLIILAVLPIIISAVANGQPGTVAIVGTIGLIFLVILLAVAVGILVSMCIQIIWRECVINDFGVFESFRSGWRKTIRYFKDVGLLWLILLGLQIGYGIVMIPVLLVLLLIGGIFGGGAGFAIYLLGRAAFQGTALFPAVIFGGLILISIIAIPMTIMSGLMEVYLSTCWTLGYQQISAISKFDGAILEATEESKNDGDN